MMGWGGRNRRTTSLAVTAGENREQTRRAEFERLAHEHGLALYGAALRMARNPEDAQDLAQETLVRAYAAFDSFAPGTNFRAWILRILTNHYIMLYRRRQRVAFLSWEETETETGGGLDAVPGENQYEPEVALLQNVLPEEMEQALARLSEAVRLTLLLVDVEQLSYEETSEALGIPVGTVRSRLNRGREQMRGFLQVFARERGLVS